MKLLLSSFSCPGGRTVNQDYCASHILGDFSCFALADGLGGHPDGDTASKAAVEAILARFAHAPGLSPDTLRECLLAGQNSVLEAQKHIDMRTTAVALVIGKKGALWGHVGDSRLYFFRRGAIFMQTEDHSVPQAMVNAGALHSRQIRGHEDRNRLLRSLGKEEDFRPTILSNPHGLREGDAFLLCSDGFWEYVTETEMEIEIAKSDTPEKWLNGMERRILTKAEPEHDNYSAIAVFVQ